MYTFAITADTLLEFVFMRILYAILAPVYLLLALFQGPGNYGPGA